MERAHVHTHAGGGKDRITTSPGSVDPSRCPLCGRPNECGAVKGEATCWCATFAIPRDVLARVPLEARGVACVCPVCAGMAELHE